MRKVKVSDIIITDAFAATNPSNNKLNKYRSMWDKFNRQPKYITINENNILIDGYIQFLLLKEKGIEEAECLIRHTGKKNNINTYKNMSTTYVYGVHLNSKDTKTYMWRVPNSWSNWADNIQIGDTIMCSTKNGYAPVVVNKIVILDKCPIDIPVKKVCNKQIRRNGIIVEI